MINKLYNGINNVKVRNNKTNTMFGFVTKLNKKGNLNIYRQGKFLGVLHKFGEDYKYVHSKDCTIPITDNSITSLRWCLSELIHNTHRDLVTITIDKLKFLPK